MSANFQLRRLAMRLNLVAREFGLDVRRMGNGAREIGPAYRRYRRARPAFAATESVSFVPALHDRRSTNGSTFGHYFQQDLLVAQLIHRANPRRHVDLGSRVDGFVAHVASFREIEVVDVRPPTSSIPNVRHVVEDASLGTSEHFADNGVDSISCLHALEHFGLGRYGDPLRPDGHYKGIRYLFNVLDPHGVLYLSMPVAAESRVELPAQRVLSLPDVLQLLEPGFAIRRIHMIDDDGLLRGPMNVQAAIDNIPPDLWFGCLIVEAERNAGADPYVPL